MLDLQSALNVGEGLYFESEEWMEIEIESKRRELDSRPEWPISLIEPGRREACVIDPLLGTSVKLLAVMVSSPFYARYPVILIAPSTHKVPNLCMGTDFRAKQQNYSCSPAIQAKQV